MSVSNFSTSAFKLAKSTFLENAFVLAPGVFFYTGFCYIVRKIKCKFYNFVLPPNWLTLHAAWFSLYLKQLVWYTEGGSTSPSWYLQSNTWYEVETYTRHIPSEIMIMIDDIITSITCYGYNLQTRKRWKPGTFFSSKFVRCIGMARWLHHSRHCGCHVTCLQFTDQIQNENQI